MPDAFYASQYFCMGLTLAAFCLGSAIQRRWKHPLLNPILLGAIGVMTALLVLDIPNEVYQAGCKSLQCLLTPATICLAISFYEQFQGLRKHVLAITLGVLAGTLSCLGFLFLGSRLLGLPREVMVALLPKSVTAAIGLSLCQELGGIGAITTGLIALTGIFGNILGPWMCRLFRIRSQVARGAAFGTASHVIGTARAAELSELTGAVSSLSLTVAGLLTVVLLSFAAQFL